MAKKISLLQEYPDALKFLNNFGDIYRKATLKKLAKGRSTLGLVGAALYAACRVTATPKTISDIATLCNLPTKDVMTHYKLILKELSLQVPVLRKQHTRCVATGYS